MINLESVKIACCFQFVVNVRHNPTASLQLVDSNFFNQLVHPAHLIPVFLRN